MNQTKKLHGIVDAQEWAELLSILEDMEDQEEAKNLLGELNQKSKIWGQLFLNIDQNFDHQEWKGRCDRAQEELQEVIQKIRKNN
jgi:hypothetical protein